jgi:hypothetical protein
MKLNTSIPKGLKSHYQKELEHYRKVFNKNQLQQALLHLERAHIIGQPYLFQHSEVHWLMLKFSFKGKNGKEILARSLD